jgi:hypothetical protein
VTDYPREIRDDPDAMSKAARQFEAMKHAFIGSFVRQAEGWGGHHIFYCHEAPLVGWQASVRIEVDLTYAWGSPPSASVSTTPVTAVDTERRASATHGSLVVELNEGVGLRQVADAMIPESIGPSLHSEPALGEGGSTPGGLPGLVAPRRNPPEAQLTLSHEVGHLFGLGDEYVEKDEKDKRLYKSGYGPGDPTEHSKLAASMLGKSVKHGDDNATIMAQGMNIGPQHGVTFLAALRSVTGLRWEFEPPTR